MKKLLALFLAILMIASVALVSCQAKKATTGGNTGGDDPETEDNGLVIPDNLTSGTEGTGSDSSSETSGDNANGNNDDDDDNNNNNATVNGFETVTSFSVYTYAQTKIRASASMTAESVKSVEKSAELTVVAKKDTVDNEWYKVKYGEFEGYVPQNFVSTNKKDTIFTELAAADRKTITVKEGGEPPYSVNLREYPIFDVGDDFTTTKMTLKYEDTKDDNLKMIGKNESGNWYMVSYTYTDTENKRVTKNYYLAVNNKTKPYILVGGQPIETEAGGI